MYPLLKKAYAPHRNSISLYSNLLNHCFSLQSLDSAKVIHAQLIKVGLNSHTFLSSRCVDLYSHFGNVNEVLKAFDEIDCKNVISWNICLKALLEFGHFSGACHLFDEMPDKDVVSWNSMISGCASYGFVHDAFEYFSEMQDVGVKADEFTFTILLSFTSSMLHVKQIHAKVIRNGMNLSNLVLGNSLIHLYGSVRMLDYAFGVFWMMKKWDIISWNSLILSCHKLGYGEFALHQFLMMRSAGHSPDQFTISTAITVCSNLQDLEKGKPIFVLCIKMGFLSNAIVLSAAIDLFSKCNRLGDSIQLFKEIGTCDSAVFNSMISSYAWHGFAEDALQLFGLMVRWGVRPTEFSFSRALNSASLLFPVEQGCQIHSLVLKSGWESEVVVASSLMDMYTKFGLIEYVTKIFSEVGVKDLISWNTLIMGLACNGRNSEALDSFKEMLVEGPAPDQLTLAGVLTACSYGGLVDEGMSLFSSMEKNYGVRPTDDHYDPVIGMLSQAGKLKEAIEVIETKGYEPSASVWVWILNACGIHGDLVVAERVAERLLQLDPQSCLPYMVLARMYEMRAKWESLVQVRKLMKERDVKKVIGCSWIGIRNRVIVFKADQMIHQGGKDVHLILNLMTWEMKDGGYVCQQHDKLSFEVEEE